MSWPTPQEYREAVQNPTAVFSDPELTQSVIEVDGQEMPKPRSGNFAVVYKATVGHKAWAVRCFMREMPGQEQRYTAIHEELERQRLDFTVAFRYQTRGIKVSGHQYPILKMEWVQADGLVAYITKHLSDAGRLDRLGDHLAGIVNRLSSLGIAHGDLQHGNILVMDDRPMLIDYDGMFVRALAGQRSVEIGHVNYQHPSRNETHFGPTLDLFSLWVIYLSLKGLAANQKLWDIYPDHDECLLFRKKDFTEPSTSAVFRELEKSPSPIVRLLTKLFRCFLPFGPLEVPPPPSFSDLASPSPQSASEGGPVRPPPLSMGAPFPPQNLFGEWLSLPAPVEPGSSMELRDWLLLGADTPTNADRPLLGEDVLSLSSFPLPKKEGFELNPEESLALESSMILNSSSIPLPEEDGIELAFGSAPVLEQATLLIAVLLGSSLLLLTLLGVVRAMVTVSALCAMSGGWAFFITIRYWRIRSEALRQGTTARKSLAEYVEALRLRVTSISSVLRDLKAERIRLPIALRQELQDEQRAKDRLSEKHDRRSEEHCRHIKADKDRAKDDLAAEGERTEAYFGGTLAAVDAQYKTTLETLRAERRQQVYEHYAKRIASLDASLPEDEREIEERINWRDQKIKQLTERIEQSNDVSREAAIAARHREERNLLRRSEQMLRTLDQQLSNPGQRIGFWRFLRWIERGG